MSKISGRGKKHIQMRGTLAIWVAASMRSDDEELGNIFPAFLRDIQGLIVTEFDRDTGTRTLNVRDI
jgi:hypothetical protein